MKIQVDGQSDIKIKNTLSTQINPATEDTLQTMVSGIATPTSISGGTKTVALAGTREALAGSTAVKRVIISANQTNTGMVVVGGSNVVAASVGRNGIALPPLASIELIIDNLQKIYLDVEVSGEGVSYIYLN